MQKNGIVVLVWGLLFLICMSTGIAHADERFGMPKEATDQLIQKVEDSREKRGVAGVVETYSQNGWTFSSASSEEYMGELMVSTLYLSWYCYPGVCRGHWYFQMSSGYGLSEMWQGDVASVSLNDIGEMVVDTGSDIIGEVSIAQSGVLSQSDKNTYSALMPGTILRILTTGRERTETSDFVHPFGDAPVELFRRWKSTSSWIYYATPGKG